MMQMERERVNGGDHHHHHHFHSPYADRAVLWDTGSPISPRAKGGVGFIEHPVSKRDTLAGVAIKYGVEVADIKRINGLVTDLQMFGLKSLQIPTPGRHPPSTCLSNGSETPRSCVDQSTTRRHSEFFDSFQSLKKTSPQQVTSAMRSLRGYYGLQPENGNGVHEGCEMAGHRQGSAQFFEDEFLPGAFSTPNRPLSRHRKCRSVANGLSDNVPVTDAGEMDSDKPNEKLVRRRQKSEADFSTRTSEQPTKEDNSSSGGFPGSIGKALRPKSTNRTALAGETDAIGWLNPIGLGDSFVADVLSGVRKSSSTSNLQEQDSTNSLSIWPTSKWSLKPDLQALSTVAIARPIFEGLPIPTGRRNKTAVD